MAVTLPDGSVAHGHVQGTAQAAPQGSPSSSGSQQQAATVTVVVGFDSQPASTGLGGAAVQAAITTRTQRDALIAPISALLARPSGGFQVTVVTGRPHRNVTVQTGLFDDSDGVDAITGPGITAGTRVEVPQS